MINIKALILAALSAVCIMVSSCYKDEPDPDQSIDYEFITLKVDGVETRSDSLWFTAGSGGKLSVEELPDAVWSIKDNSVASLNSDGSLKALKPGKTSVLAVKGDKSVEFGLVIPDFSGDQFDIKGADFTVVETEFPGLGTLCHSKTSIKAYVWEAVLTMEDHFYSVDFWHFTPNPEYTEATVNNFVSKLNTYTGKRFRLPTNAEYELMSKSGVCKGNSYTSDGAAKPDCVWIIKD